MAITTAMTTSFKVELFKGLHDFTGGSPQGDNFKLALIRSGRAGQYGAATTNYSQISGSPTDEIGETGSYVYGGGQLVCVEPTSSGTTAFVDFNDLAFTSATISADGMMIYNATNGNRTVSVHDFGGTKTSTNGTFTIVFPVADASNAILRLA
jgi:hypothetical protein